MTTIAEFVVEAEEFVLSSTLERNPDAVVEVERVVSVTDQPVTPYFWVHDGDPDAFEAALADDPSVGSFRALERRDGEQFYRATWVEGALPLRYVIEEDGGVIFRAVASDGTWRVRILFPDGETLSEFHERCGRHDISFELQRVFQEHAEPEAAHYNLTEPQEALLRTAAELGYYQVPREAALVDVASELDVSPQAASDRMRRAHGTMVEEMLGLAAVRE